MTPITPLEGREKVNVHIVANKVNEIIEVIEEVKKNLEELKK